MLLQGNLTINLLFLSVLSLSRMPDVSTWTCTHTLIALLGPFVCMLYDLNVCIHT